MLRKETLSYFERGKEIQTKYINTLCGQKVESFLVKPANTQTKHEVLKDHILI